MKCLIILCSVALAYAVSPSCLLEPETGPCKAYFVRYHFDAELGDCVKFVYGGCRGNENNFASLEACREACSVSQADVPDVPVCEQDADRGLCLAYMPRYYYDKKTGKCTRFIYGGCQGNQNNFKTIEECESTCGAREYSLSTCQQKPETGMCRGYFPRFYYDYESGQCKKFIFGGCGGNDNNFESENDCQITCGKSESEDVCSLKKQPGLCDAYMPRYYYNQETGRCERFIYGGCGGNGNNFRTLRECEQECPAVERHPTEPDCDSAPETGPCRARITRYHFDKSTGECSTFTYGGCRGNGNNYKTEDECLSTCATERTEDVCSLEKSTGLCKAYMPRYYYNQETGRCERFIYGGCGGNGNNFASVEECEDQCRV